MSEQTQPALQIRGLRHAYGQSVVLAGVDLTVAPGELVALLGASGCGKTTLLRAVAGLLTPSGGRIEVGGRLVVDEGRELVDVRHRGVGLVFQDYALFPQMNVADNVAFGLAGGDTDRVRHLLALAGLTELASRRPGQLSGGQQQRVALVRALAPRPHLLLLDEPFSNVDAERRRRLGHELRTILRSENAAALLVTHDRADALQLSDRVAAVVAGDQGAVIAQVGPPPALYREPASRAVAYLTGPAWFLAGQAEGGHADTSLGRVALSVERSGPVVLVVRPEQARWEPSGDHTVLDRHFTGRGYLVVAETPAGRVEVESVEAPGQRGRVVVSEPVWPLPGEGQAG